MKQHVVYKITNRLNDKYYIGVHSTTNINDNYMGSGTRLRWAQKKYGIKNFTREILYVFDSRLDALNKESELVDLQTLEDKKCYNLVVGGSAGNITTRELRKLHTRFKITEDRVCEKLSPYEKWDADWYYKFELKNNFEYKVEISDNAPLRNILTKKVVETFKPDVIMDLITRCYNDKKLHKDGIKWLKYYGFMEGFYNNIICYDMTWSETNSNLK